MRYELDREKGVAGLTILLTVVTLLFVIGLVVMLFLLMSGGLKETSSILAEHTSSSTTQNNVSLIDTTAGSTLTSCDAQIGGDTITIALVNNSGGETISTGNYTIAGCVLQSTADAEYNNTWVNVTYVYTYAGETYKVVNDTGASLSDVPDWFPIIIVITAMVVLILLTVIIINAIRGSGLLATGEGGNNVGTA